MSSRSWIVVVLVTLVGMVALPAQARDRAAEAEAVRSVAASRLGVGGQVSVMAERDEDGDLTLVWMPDPLGLRTSRRTSMRRDVPNGACDDETQCEEASKKACESHGHGGVQQGTVTITKHVDGSKTCSADCEKHGAVTFTICNPSVVQ